MPNCSRELQGSDVRLPERRTNAGVKLTDPLIVNRPLTIYPAGSA